MYVERLVSQNRNLIRQISGPTTVYVGETCTYQYLTATACPGAVTVAALQSPGWVIASLTVGPTSTLTVVATVTAGKGTTVTNTVSVIPYATVVDAVTTNNTASDADAVLGAVNVSISKPNGVSTLAARSTTAYTGTVVAADPNDANGSVLRDPADAGLSCTSVTCAGVTGEAVCPPAAE